MSSTNVKTFAGYGNTEAGGLLTEARRVFANSATWLHERRVYRNTVAELSVLSDRDLADIGIVRSDIQALAREAAKGQRNAR